MWSNFKDLLFASVADLVPVATQKGCTRKPWITSDIVLLSRKKRRAYKIAMANKDKTNLWLKYKTIRNQHNYLIR